MMEEMRGKGKDGKQRGEAEAEGKGGRGVREEKIVRKEWGKKGKDLVKRRKGIRGKK